MASLCFDFKDLHHFFHNGSTHLHSNQQCVSIPFSPQTCQHLLFPVFWFLAIVTEISWYFIEVLIYSFPLVIRVFLFSYICWSFVPLSRTVYWSLWLFQNWVFFTKHNFILNILKSIHLTKCPAIQIHNSFENNVWKTISKNEL